MHGVTSFTIGLAFLVTQAQGKKAHRPRPSDHNHGSVKVDEYMKFAWWKLPAHTYRVPWVNSYKRQELAEEYERKKRIEMSVVLAGQKAEAKADAAGEDKDAAKKKAWALAYTMAYEGSVNPEEAEQPERFADIVNDVLEGKREKGIASWERQNLDERERILKILTPEGVKGMTNEDLVHKHPKKRLTREQRLDQMVDQLKQANAWPPPPEYGLDLSGDPRRFHGLREITTTIEPASKQIKELRKTIPVNEKLAEMRKKYGTPDGVQTGLGPGCLLFGTPPPIGKKKRNGKEPSWKLAPPEHEQYGHDKEWDEAKIMRAVRRAHPKPLGPWDIVDDHGFRASLMPSVNLATYLCVALVALVGVLVGSRIQSVFRKREEVRQLLLDPGHGASRTLTSPQLGLLAV